MESRQHIVVKASLWTVLGLVTMAFVGLAFTGSIATGGSMAVVNASIGFACYLIYDRIWARISWGRR